MPKNEDHSPIDSLIRDWGDVRVHIGFDVDLEKFFDRVNHDILMDRVRKRIGDYSPRSG